jgi:hypothetical protein
MIEEVKQLVPESLNIALLQRINSRFNEFIQTFLLVGIDPSMAGEIVHKGQKINSSTSANLCYSILLDQLSLLVKISDKLNISPNLFHSD